MGKFIRILLFGLAVFIANVNAESATIAFPNVTSYSPFHTEIPKTVLKVIENDLMNCCKNERNLVYYRDWGKRIEGKAAKGGGSIWTSTKKTKFG